MTYPIPIFIGYDNVESIAYHTLVHSLVSNSTTPISVNPVCLSHYKHIFDRDRDPLQSNEFAFSRWLVPYIQGYEGWAIFMDCDMLCLGDITKLWDLRDPRYAVQCVKHHHVPKEVTKYLGNVQTVYERKNWSSLMLINCSRCQALTPLYVETAPGLDLHQFKWLDESLIGELPKGWNFLVGYDTLDTLVGDLNLIHFTTGGPWFEDYKDVEFKDVWWRAFEEMKYCKQS